MNWLSDHALARLQRAAAEPDFHGTRYNIVDELGRGGMATIYLALDHELNREVAIKVLDLPDVAGDLRERMLREANIIARLEHPGIVPIHDVGVLPDERVYYVMKRVKGERLDAFVQKSLSEKLRVFEKICEAVAFAHAQGVIHRDLKPENIMVGGFGEVLVMDWGLAKALDPARMNEASTGMAAPQENPNPADTGHGAVFGTPGYMAPEQTRGDAEAIGERTDVYGLGAILYFLLTGHPPVHPGSSNDPSERPASPRHENPKVGRALNAICLKAIAADPQERYAKVEELRSDIVAFLDDRPVSAYKENPFQIIMRWVSRNHFVVILVLAYLVMRVLLLLFLHR